MKFKELKALSTDDIDKKYDDATFELMKLRAQSASGTTLQSPGQVKQLRRMMAQILTIKNISKDGGSKKTK